MKPYASDLRDRIIRVLESGEEPPGTMAERFWVRLSVVEKRWQRFRRRGRRAAQPHAGGKRRALKDHTALLRREVETQPDAPLEAVRERMAAAQGPRVSSATICRALPRRKLPIKKIAPRAGTRPRAGPDVAHHMPRPWPGARRPMPAMRGCIWRDAGHDPALGSGDAGAAGGR